MNYLLSAIRYVTEINQPKRLLKHNENKLHYRHTTVQDTPGVCGGGLRRYFGKLLTLFTQTFTLFISTAANYLPETKDSASD